MPRRGRIRNVHPEQWTRVEFCSCSPLARVLLLALRNESDDNGIFRWHPQEHKIRLLPMDAMMPDQMNDLLTELVDAKELMRFEIAGIEYAMHRDFHLEQRPNKPTFYYPTPTEPLPDGYRIRVPVSSTPTEPLPNQDDTTTTGREGKGKVGEGKGKVGEGKVGKGKNPPKTKPPVSDPLEKYRVLQEFYPKLCSMIVNEHPHAILPAESTKAWTESRLIIAQLVRVNKYPVPEIVDCLTWLFQADHKEAVWWRDKVQSPRGLRDCKSDGSLTKFGKIHKEWTHRDRVLGGKPPVKDLAI